MEPYTDLHLLSTGELDDLFKENEFKLRWTNTAIEESNRLINMGEIGNREFRNDMVRLDKEIEMREKLRDELKGLMR